MHFEFPISASRPYVCPPDASPAWRAACEAGLDMAELEGNLRLTPWERLKKHDQKLGDHLKREEFLELLNHGWKFIQSQHVHPR